MRLTSIEYLNELVEEVISTATEYGRNDSRANEIALGEASDLLYKALEWHTKSGPVPGCVVSLKKLTQTANG